MARIKSISQLREIYPAVQGRSAAKEMKQLDNHCRNFLELSPFVILGTVGSDGVGDVTPRGETPGFVQAPDNQTLLIPDRPGNNRLDTLTNLMSNPGIGLLFLIPGVEETLRVNGRAEVRDDPELQSQFEVAGKKPRSVIRVTIEQVYLHCAKSILRAGLWMDESRIDRSLLPSMAEMLRDQIGSTDPVESREDRLKRFEKMRY